TTIKYRLDRPDSFVKLSMYNTNGELLKKLFEGSQSAGVYSVKWNASNYSSGTYFCRLNVDGLLKSIKLIYLK
ncbi:MAG: FlgD immunoglobulin-like domain containing protein, partial [Ignavibacteriota bacterium]